MIKIDATQVIANFERSLDLTRDMSPLLLEILGDEQSTSPWTIRGSIFMAFKDQQSPDGTAWEELKDSTIKEKEKKYPGMPILYRTGDYFNSLVSSNQYTVGPAISFTSLEFGTSTPYASFHQTGTSKMAQRKTMDITDDQTKAWGILVSKYLVDAVAGRGE